jgi:replicative DNA helicase
VNTRRILEHERRRSEDPTHNDPALDPAYVRLSDAMGAVASLPISFDETSRTVAQMRAKARRLKATHGDLEMIVVDHVHEMEGPGDSREQVVNKIGVDLKAMAKELDVAVVAAGQLNRKVEDRADKRPMLSDLRDSGGLEQVSDVVLLLHRPEYYFGKVIKAERKGAVDRNVEGLAEVIVAKQRDGETGSVEVFFRKECTRFENLTAEDYNRF